MLARPATVVAALLNHDLDRAATCDHPHGKTTSSVIAVALWGLARIVAMGAENLVLLGPLRRKSGRRATPRPWRKPAVDGRLDQIGCEESQQDCHVDHSSAAVFSLVILSAVDVGSAMSGLERMCLICLLHWEGPERPDGDDNATYPSYRFCAARPYSGRA